MRRLIDPSTLRRVARLVRLAAGPLPARPPRPHGNRYRALDAAGQRRAEGSLLVAYQLAWRYARWQARDVPPDDLIGEALFALTYAAGRYQDGHRVPFEAYAHRVIRHWLAQAVGRWRRARRGMRWPPPRSLPEEEAGREGGSWEGAARPAPDPAAREMCEQLRRALPGRLYEVLRLHHADGYSLSEVGRRLGVTRERARQLLDAARRRARAAFPGWIGN